MKIIISLVQQQLLTTTKVMNEILKNAGKEILKELLEQCTDGQQLMFKRMYCHKNIDLPINDAVDQMPDDKIDWAISQCERTVAKNWEL